MRTFEATVHYHEYIIAEENNDEWLTHRQTDGFGQFPACGSFSEAGGKILQGSPIQNEPVDGKV
jgi:hypothetical protein